VAGATGADAHLVLAGDDVPRSAAFFREAFGVAAFRAGANPGA
jgi:hypothetical protein